MKRETRLHLKVIKMLNTRGHFAIKIPGSGLLRGMPDILAVVHGRAFFVETKTKEGDASLLQVAVINKLRRAGAIALMATSVDEVTSALDYHFRFHHKSTQMR